MAQPGVSCHIKPRKACRGWWVILSVAALSMDVAAQEAALPGKFYRIVDGKVDPRTYDGYRRYHAVCNHLSCRHGAVASTAKPSLPVRTRDVANVGDRLSAYALPRRATRPH